MISSAALCQTKGFGSSFHASRSRTRWPSTRTGTLVNTPRFSRRLVSSAKKRSTRLSQEELVGVKWRCQRACGGVGKPVGHVGSLMGREVVQDDVDLKRRGTERSIFLKKAEHVVGGVALR